MYVNGYFNCYQPCLGKRGGEKERGEAMSRMTRQINLLSTGTNEHTYQEMVYCSGSTLGIVPLDNSPFVLGSGEGLWSKLSGKAHD